MKSENFTEELLSVLLGNHVSESIPLEVRSELYQTRSMTGGTSTLESELIFALKQKRNLVVAGSAGGGKTMLIEYLKKKLNDDGVDLSKIFIVQDLTAITGNRAKFLRSGIKEHGQYIVAANEGILREPDIQKVLVGSWETMRNLQNGIHEHNSNLPIVVDVAGLDPLATFHGVLLNTEIRKAVILNEEKCPQNSEYVRCPRIVALELLDSEMATLVVSIIQSVFASGELTYRDLWNFVSDIFLGGDCNGEVPDSAWFWRMFKGKSSISARLDEKHRPEILPMLGITPYLYRGDWEFIENKLKVGNYNFVDPGSAPQELLNSKSSSDLLCWLKIQIALILRASRVEMPKFIGESMQGIETKVLREGRMDIIAGAINSYFKRETVSHPANVLQLWVDMGTERKRQRSKTLVGIGYFPKKDLVVVRSQTIGNLPGVGMDGTRAYLRSKFDKTSSLELSTDLFEALQQGRPLSTERRKFDDIDFALRKFFLSIFGSDLVEDASLIYSLGDGVRDRNSISTFRILLNDKFETVGV